MTKRTYKYAAFIIFAFAIATIAQACNESSASRNAHAGIIRLDTALDGNLMVDSIKGPMTDYMAMMGLDGDDLKGAMQTYKKTDAFKTFYPEVKRSLGSLAEVEKSLGLLNAKLSEAYTAVAPQKYYGIVSPYRQQIILADSATYIVLNHYLGPDNEIYESMPVYMKSMKKKERIPLDVAEALLRNAYPYRPAAGSTTLTRMIYEGALAHAVNDALEVSDIGSYNNWGAAENDFAAKHEPEIWKSLIVNDYLYSTDPVVAERLIADAPSAGIISGEVPAKIGRFIGYRIIDSYLANHGDVRPEQMLQPEFYNDSAVLIDSGYAPEKK